MWRPAGDAASRSAVIAAAIADAIAVAIAAATPADAAVAEALTAARVPHAPVLSLEQAIEHEHFVERGTVRTVHDPRLGELKLAGFPVHTSEPLPELDLVAAALGEHNHEVLQGWLGMPDEQLADLADRGIIASKPH